MLSLFHNHKFLLVTCWLLTCGAFIDFVQAAESDPSAATTLLAEGFFPTQADSLERRGNVGGGNSQVIEPELPGALPPVSAGFFPTQAETPLLRGAANARSGYSNGYTGPDIRAQTATDLFPYEDQSPNFYQRNPIFHRMDQVLGVFAGQNSVTTESDRMRHAALTFSANSGLLTRTFSPDLATLKAGPLAFDLLYIGAGAVWSDYNGIQNYKSGQGDGFVSYINLGLRGYMRLTDTIHLAAAAQLIYLPGTNELAFGMGYGSGNSLGVTLNYSDTWGAWDVMFSDRFVGRPGLNFYARTTEDGSDRAGRYWYGIQQSNSYTQSNFFNNNGAFFGNTVQFAASRLVLGGRWRFMSQIDHSDFWRTFDFVGHAQREHLGLAMGYEGSVIPFAPRFTYDVYSSDRMKSFRHLFALTLTGRITENIDWGGSVGYGFATGATRGWDKFLWSMRLNQALTARTQHSLSFGENFFLNDYTNDSLSARFAGYQLSHGFARNLTMSLLAQVSDRESYASTGSTSSGISTSRVGGGIRVSYQPLDFTSINASIFHDESLKPVGVFDRWISRVSINQQLGMRLTGSLFYQYLENNGSGTSQFSEHAIGFTLRRYF